MQKSRKVAGRGSRGAALPWVIAVLIALTSAGFVGWNLWPQTDSTSASRPQRAGQPVTVAAVRRQDMPLIVQAIGTITALNTSTVSARVAGVLQSLHFDEGEQVAAGQLLAQIDARAFEASVAFAEGVLARDEAQLEGARSDLARYRRLATRDGVSRQQVDTQAALVRQLEGTVRASEATLTSARIELDNTRVTAPIAGRVGLKQIDLGNLVQPDGSGIVTITQTRPIALSFAVPSSRLNALDAQLRAGDDVPVEAWSPDGRTRLATGTVASMDNTIDRMTDTIRVKARFPNADDSLFPNQPVGVRLQLDVLRNALTVPRAAIMRGSQGFYVFLVNDDDTVSVRLVQTGLDHDDWIVVEGDLQPDARVVIDGVDRLRDGASIRIIPDDPDKRVALDDKTVEPARHPSSAPPR